MASASDVTRERPAPPGFDPGTAPMPIQNQRARINDAILTAAQIFSADAAFGKARENVDNVSVFKLRGDSRFFIEVHDRESGQDFLFYTALKKRGGGDYEVDDTRGDYNRVREVNHPETVTHYPDSLPSSVIKLNAGDKVNDELITIAVSKARLSISNRSQVKRYRWERNLLKRIHGASQLQQ